MKKKSKAKFKIINVSTKKTPDNKEIYDCLHKTEVVEEVDLDCLNLKHYRSIAVLREKRENSKKKNLEYTVLMIDNGNTNILTLKESDFVKYMTRAEFKELLNNYLNYENTIQQTAKREEE